jgi:hypothetical protein
MRKNGLEWPNKPAFESRPVAETTRVIACATGGICRAVAPQHVIRSSRGKAPLRTTTPNTVILEAERAVTAPPLRSCSQPVCAGTAHFCCALPPPPPPARPPAPAHVHVRTWT